MEFPFINIIKIWGEEVYFETDIIAEVEHSIEVVTLGDVDYWAPGKTL